MRIEEEEDELAFIGSKKTRSGSRMSIGRLIALVIGLLLIALIGFGAFKIFQKVSGDEAASNNAYLSYRTIGRVDLRSSPSSTSPVKSVLKEGTMLSGKTAGTKDGIEWIEGTTVDGVYGFLPLPAVRVVGTSTDLRQVIAEQRRVVTSTSVNLRSLPSLSSQIIGVVDGGSRLASDGYVMSEGERWIRVPLSSDITAFIMARFTTPDDDRAGSAEGFEGEGAVGVGGIVTKVMNVQATPFDGARVIRPLMVDEQVRILGQTNAGIAWYVVRLMDGVQGFIPKDAIRVSETANRWVYPDGSPAPGPNIPQMKNGVLVKPGGGKAKSSANAPDGQPVIVDMNAPATPEDPNATVNTVTDQNGAPPVNQ